MKVHDSLLDALVNKPRNESRVDPKYRFIDDLSSLETILPTVRDAGKIIVLTQGTFDMFHIGHVRYLQKAREHGDVLIVGLDDDEKARDRKGENRPVVPFVERVEILTQTNSADIVLTKRNDYPKWHLIKVIRPDVLIAVEGTYTDEEILSLGAHCKQVTVLKRQAETSTSAKVRKLVLDGAEMLTKALTDRLPSLVQSVYQDMKGGAT